MINLTKPYELQDEHAPAYWQVDILWTVLASSEQTGGSYTLLQQLCPQDSGPTPHYHDQDEAFYILDGEITFLAGDETIEGAAGSFIWIPRGTVHAFRVKSATARILNSYTPGGFERIIIALGEPALERVLPPRGRPLLGDREKITGVMQEIGMHVVNQPMFCESRADLPHSDENNPNAWRNALKDIYAMGYLEVEEAKEAGLLPAEWEVPGELRDRHRYITVKERVATAREHNRLCLRIARAGPLCPHCSRYDKIRFLNRMPDIEELRQQGLTYVDTSYFICNACARSFGHDNLQAIKTTQPVEPGEPGDQSRT